MFLSLSAGESTCTFHLLDRGPGAFLPLFMLILLSIVSCLLVFQVFVNFAREQQAEDESRTYDNPVDTSDELPLRLLQGKEV